MSGEIRTVRGGGVFLKGNGYSIFSEEDLREVGPNSEVLLTITTPGLPFTYSGRDCIKGLPDPIGYAFADAYLMEFNSEKWIRDGAVGKEVYVPQGTKLVDISDSPAAIGGIVGDTLQEHFLGFTGPEGKIALGKDYSILIDECQNTLYDQINPGGFGSQDSILVDAFTADSKVEGFAPVCDSILPLPSHCESSIKDLKHDAGVKLNLILDEFAISQAEFNGLKELVKSGVVDAACSAFPRAEEFTCKVITKSGIEFFAPSIVAKERKDALEKFYLLKKYDKVYNDPPNFNYKNLTTMQGNTLLEFKDSFLSTDPYYQSVQNVINNFTMEATLIPPMVSSMEGYLGADESGDILWMPIHALEVANFSRLLSQQISTTNIALSTLKLAIEQDSLTSPENINSLNQENQKIASTGFNNTELRELQNLGLGDKIDVVRSAISSNHFPTDVKQKALTSITNLIKLNTQQIDHLFKLSEQMNINSNTAMQKFRDLVQYDLPVSDAGGPYTGLEGNNIILDGTKSKATQGTKLVTYQWDLDSDGQFDDAEGATVPYVFKEFAGFIGLKVTNEFGRSSIDYSRINIANSLQPPKISNFSPDKPMIILDINQPVDLNISATSTASTLKNEWTIDGKLTSSTGTSITYTPSNNDIGSHSIVVKVSDEDGRYVTNQWIVVVIKPDNDNDNWHANVDCVDSDPNISPGMKEIRYNGIDDDCDPATLDDNTPPIADNQTLTAFQNQTSTFSLTGSDIDNDLLTFSIIKQTENGTLGNVTKDTDQSAIVEYKPKLNFHGTDKFVIVANDGNDTSNNATIQVNVAIADSPIAHDQTLVINENTATEVELTASSPDGHPLHFSIGGQKVGGITGQPSVGTIKNFQITGPYSAKVTYLPGPNFASDRYGFNDSLSFSVNDGPPLPGFEGREASTALVTIKVNDVNNAPEPFNKVIHTTKNEPINITLRAADADNDFFSQGSKTNNGLTFSLVEQPLHGTVGQIITNSTTIRFPPQSNGTENFVTYTPNIDFVGQDIFTFKANDGTQNSIPGNVSVIVGPANQTFSQFEDGDVLVGTLGEIALCDLCGEGPQWYKSDGTFVKTLPSSVPTISPTLSGGAFDSSGNLYVSEFGTLVTYFPQEGFNGVSIYNKTGGYTGGWGNHDDFGCTSAAVSALPCMLPESVVVDKKDNIYVGGVATQATDHLELGDHRDDIRKFDRNGHLLEIFDVAAENRGTDWIELAPDQCTMYYTSEDIHVKRYNVCTHSQMEDFANVYGVGRSSQDLGGSQALPNYALRLLPDGGMIVASQNEIWRIDSGGNLVQRYDAPGEQGWFALNLNPDGKSFWSASNGEPDVYQFDLSSGKILQHFKTHDNAGISGIYVKGEPIVSTTEFQPTVFSQNLTTNKNIPLSINLTGFDIANDQLDFSIGNGPSSGTLSPITKLSSNISRVTYTPNIDFQGSDSFTFKANDGKLDSNNTGSVHIIVNHEPIAFNDVVNTLEGQSIRIPVLTNDTDEDQDVMSIVSVNSSSVLGHIVVNPDETISYTPFTNFSGRERFNYTITDSKGGNDSAQVIVNIIARNVAPISNSQNVTTVKNGAINITLTGSDMNNDTLTFSRFFGPYNGFVSKFNSTSGLLQYTPLKNFHGQDSFTFRVSDGKDRSLPSIVNITVRDDGSNDPPNAVSERTSTERNKPLLINVLSNDDDPNGDSLSIGSISGPVNGTALVNQNETITFTPLRNFNGTDVFIYNVTDGKGGSDIAQVIVDVRGPPTNAPTVQDQSLSTNKNMPLNITLTGTSPSGSTLTFSVIDKSAHGNLSQILPINNTAAKLVYTPTINFTDNDLFTFKANNGTMDSNIGTVTIAVNGTVSTNTSPIARDDSANTNEDKPVVIPVLVNDTDVDGDTLAVDSIKLQSLNGSSAINSNGTVTYSPNTNFYGSDGFDYTITDGRGGNATARVSVSVNSVNDPPLPSNDIANTLQDRPVVIDVLANDTDPEGDALVISAISNPPSNGTAMINNNGTITFSSPTGFSGSDTFDYQVSDGNGGNSTASVLVNVISAVNRPPVVTISSPINGSQFMQGDRVAFSGSATDPEDGNISSVMTWESSIDGPLGIGPNIIASSLSQGVHTITASAIDSAQLSNSSSIDISVNVAGNQPPVAVGDQFKTNEDTPLNMNVIANDTDPDNDQLPVTGLAQNPNNGQANINNINNTITYAPNPNFNGQDSFVYKISDGKGGNSSALVSIEVLAVNDNPIAKSDIVITDQDKPIIIDVLANDSDIDNDRLTISQVTSPTDGNTVIENSKVKYTPNANFAGSDNFDYTISDGNGGSATASVTIQVTHVNQQPTASDGSASTNEDASVNIKLNASDPDNDALTYIIDTQPPHGAISSLDTKNGTLLYTPQSNFNGQDSLKFKVNDGNLDSSVGTILITIKPVNDLPLAKDDTASTSEGVSLSINNLLANDNDPDGDVLTISSASSPSHGSASVNANKTSVTYTPVPNFNGQDSFSYTISDGHGGTATANVVITINHININHAPTAENQNVITDMNKQVNIILKGSDSDQGDTITFSIVTGPAHGTVAGFDKNTGQLAYIPNTGFAGGDSLTFKVTDNHGIDSNMATVSITVNQIVPNHPPVANVQTVETNKNTPKDILLTGKDPDIGDTILFAIVQSPSNGQISNFDKTTGKLTYIPKTGFVGSDSFRFKVIDNHGDESNIAAIAINVKQIVVNNPPDCTKAFPSITELWPPNHKLTPISIKNVIDPDRDQVIIKITKVLQDEPVNGLGDGDTSPDASGIGTSIAELRAERSGTGDGRVYHIYFSADDGKENGKCNSEVLVLVPHDQAHKAVDSGPNYDSTMKVSDKSSSQTDNMKVRTKEPVEQQEQQQHQKEPQVKPEKSQPRQGSYWLTHKAETENLLPLSVGNFTVNNFEKIVAVLNIGSNNHNLYDNLGAQILTTKLNIKNDVPSCNTVYDAIKYGDDVLRSVNYKGKGTVSHKLTDPQMKNIIKAHSILMQFNIQGCAAISPTGFFFTPGIFEISYTDPFSLFVN